MLVIFNSAAVMATNRSLVVRQVNDFHLYMLQNTVIDKLLVNGVNL